MSASRRAAASSSASGIPSNRRQICAIAGALASDKAKRGSTADARSTNRRTAALRSISAAERGVSASGADSGGTAQLISPGMPIGSRLVARIWSFGHSRSSRSASAAHGSRRCSQLSNTSSTCALRSASASASEIDRSAVSRTPMAAPTRCGTSAASVTCASSTSHTPSGYCSTTRLATSIASRVLPDPPTPVRVIKRARLQPRGNVDELLLAADETGDGGWQVVVTFGTRVASLALRAAAPPHGLNGWPGTAPPLQVRARGQAPPAAAGRCRGTDAWCRARASGCRRRSGRRARRALPASGQPRRGAAAARCQTQLSNRQARRHPPGSSSTAARCAGETSTDAGFARPRLALPCCLGKLAKQAAQAGGYQCCRPRARRILRVIRSTQPGGHQR